MKISIEILGFDRLGFVYDIHHILSKFDTISVKNVHFEADGVRSVGKLQAETEQENNLEKLIEKLKSVQGLAKVKISNLP